MLKRCEWANGSDNEKQYHDTEWGVAVYDDSVLFEFLVLESMQAGLSWSIILNKRENFRGAYDNFDYNIISTYTEDKIEKLLQNEGVIRHRLKIQSTISNAQAFINIQKEFGSFSTYIWNFVDHKPIINNWTSLSDVPAQSDLSVEISKDLKKRGFKFLGPTTMYAYLQAVGIVDDHMDYCFKRSE